MYATVRTYSAGPALADALVSNKTNMKHLIPRSKRFKAYHLIRTAEGAVSISIYETEAGANEWTNAAAAFIRERMPEVAGSTPQVSSGEVVISA